MPGFLLGPTQPETLETQSTKDIIALKGSSVNTPVCAVHALLHWIREHQMLTGALEYMGHCRQYFEAFQRMKTAGTQCHRIPKKLG